MADVIELEVPAAEVRVGAVRRLAFDRSLPAVEAIGRIRDTFHDYDEGGVREL